MLSHDAVRELVEEYRSKEEEAGQDSHGPMLRVRPKRVIVLVLLGDQVSDGSKDKDPGGMEINGNAENFADA